MIKNVEDGYLDHRIVRRSYTRTLKEYNRLKSSPDAKKTKTAAATPSSATSATTPAPVKLAGVAAAALRSNPASDFATPPESILAAHMKPKATPVTVNMAVTSSSSSSSSSRTPATPQYGGTVGVSLGGARDAYDLTRRADAASIVPQSARQDDNITAEPLLPPVGADGGAQDAEAKRAALEVVESLEASSAALTFDSAKARILRVVVREVNAAQGNEELTEEFLQSMSTKSSSEQQQELDEFGLDSMTGFKLAKSLAEEFGLPAGMMGPHLFLSDPTLDGMVGVMVQLVRLQASKARQEYTERFEAARAAPVGSAAAHDTSAHVFRGTTDERRIPYVLGIGTAVPFNCAPQSEVIQAMLGPMRMSKKSEERFIKIGENSGVGTRYSALDSLDGLFWGKEGVNSGTDEFVDARHEVYKREAVKLSIASAADCLRDWQGTRVMLSDEQRETQRLERYLAVDRKHREEQVRKKEAAAAKAKISSNKKAKVEAEAGAGAGAGGQSTAVTAEAAMAESVAELGDLRGLAGEVQGQTGRSITHVVAITCTGVIVPGLEFHIMQALGLPLTTQRLSIQFMGCFGAVSGLRCASALAAEHPRNRVLVVCTELCTLHMQLNDKIDNLVATALFADGSGAFVVGCAPTPSERPLYAIEACSSFVIPQTLDQMAWDLKKNGLHIGLAKEIAGEIFHHIGDFVGDMLRYAPDAKHPRHRVDAKDCNCAIHPGGPLILNTIQNVLGIEQVGDGHGGGEMDPHAPTLEAWEILREYGNMSSATLVFVLDRIREKKHRQGKWTPVVAFGPGLSIEGSLLKAVFPAPREDGTYEPRVAAEQTNTANNTQTCGDVDISRNIQLGADALTQRF
jgi:predicted naringenin-chalcone synthase